MINKKSEIQCKLKSISAAKADALKVGKRAQEHIINNQSEIQKRIQIAKLK